MQLKHRLGRLVSRFRYPVSLPEDVACDLGVCLPNSLPFCTFLEQLASSQSHPTKLRRYMSREEAERAFSAQLKKEAFPSCTLFSYYFSEGWVVITLYFDEHRLLRRAYVQCPACDFKEGFDLSLEGASPFSIMGS